MKKKPRRLNLLQRYQYTPKDTTDKENNSLVLAKPTEVGVKITENSMTVSQMYKQNPIVMFVGATLGNCTININMPK